MGASLVKFDLRQGTVGNQTLGSFQLRLGTIQLGIGQSSGCERSGGGALASHPLRVAETHREHDEQRGRKPKIGVAAITHDVEKCSTLEPWRWCRRPC